MSGRDCSPLYPSYLSSYRETSVVLLLAIRSLLKKSSTAILFKSFSIQNGGGKLNHICTDGLFWRFVITIAGLCWDFWALWSVLPRLKVIYLVVISFFLRHGRLWFNRQDRKEKVSDLLSAMWHQCLTCSRILTIHSNNVLKKLNCLDFINFLIPLPWKSYRIQYRFRKIRKRLCDNCYGMLFCFKLNSFFRVLLRGKETASTQANILFQ